MNIRHAIKPLLLLISAAFAQHAVASGYHFGTQSVSSQSTANSSAAEGKDASTIFYNPAGLTHLERHQVAANVNLVMPSIKYTTTSSTNYVNMPVQGSNSGKITQNVIAPHVYGAYKLNDRVTLGLGMYIPFASATEYDQDSNLRMHLNKLGLQTIAIEPVVAFKANDQHSFGVGVIGQYSKAELRKYADWSLSMARMTGNPALLGNPAAEGYAEVEGDDWGFGYHLGWLYDVNDKVRVGVNYRSKVEHNLRGTADWKATGAISEQVRPAFAASGYVPNEDANVKIVMPESLSVHGMYRPTDKLDLFADVTWTRHSRFNEAVLNFENSKTTLNTPVTGEKSNSTTITPNWRNTFKVAVGGAYQLNDQWQLRSGIAFDKSPVRNAEYRMNTLPDGNRIWFSVGAKYKFNSKHSLDLAYSHIHINDTTFNAPKASGYDVDSKGAASAKFKNFANIVGAQYTYQF